MCYENQCPAMINSTPCPGEHTTCDYLMKVHDLKVASDAIDRCIKLVKQSFPAEESTFASLLVMSMEQLKETV